MTLDDLERRNSPYFAIFRRFRFLFGQMVEYKPVLSVNIVSQFRSSTFGHDEPTLQLGLSAIAEILIGYVQSSSVGLCM